MPRFSISKKSIRIKLFIAVMIVLGCVGAYLFLLTSSPIPAATPITTPAPVLTGEEVSPVDPGRTIPKNQIVIPKIGVISRIYTGGDWALNLGVWHRFPERGDPVKGGNFILSAHRFKLDWTPERTRQLSPFYHIDKLVAGDEILVDFSGTRYTYTVTKVYAVKPDAIEIEAPSTEPHMTLYSCSLKGEADGRAVIEAVMNQ